MKKIILAILLLISLNLIAETALADTTETKKPQITFLEFGSTTCVPCKMMEDVLEEVHTIYGDSVDVIFHNVNENRKLSKEWNIKLIPAQIFLNSDGKEFHRHQGYYPTEEIVNVFAEHGLAKPVTEVEE